MHRREEREEAGWVGSELTSLGWDPIFEYEGQTYAEMSKVEKNKISHRYKALQKLKAWLETQP